MWKSRDSPKPHRYAWETRRWRIFILGTIGKSRDSAADFAPGQPIFSASSTTTLPGRARSRAGTYLRNASARRRVQRRARRRATTASISSTANAMWRIPGVFAGACRLSPSMDGEGNFVSWNSQVSTRYARWQRDPCRDVSEWCEIGRFWRDDKSVIEEITPNSIGRYVGRVG